MFCFEFCYVRLELLFSSFVVDPFLIYDLFLILQVEIRNGFGMHPMDKLAIEEQSQPANWKTLTRLALEYFYEDTLRNYCATGKRCKVRPGIDSGIYSAVLGKSMIITLQNQIKDSKIKSQIIITIDKIPCLIFETFFYFSEWATSFSGQVITKSDFTSYINYICNLQRKQHEKITGSSSESLD